MHEGSLTAGSLSVTRNRTFTMVDWNSRIMDIEKRSIMVVSARARRKRLSYGRHIRTEVGLIGEGERSLTTNRFDDSGDGTTIMGATTRYGREGVYTEN